MDVTTGTLAHNGGDLHWEAAGAGEPVVLVHGFSLDLRMWDDQFEPLAQRFRVVRYDVRGFGKSSVPDGPYSHVDDLAALLDAHGFGQAAVVGLSMGGRIALDFALAHPQRVSKLVLLDAGVSGQQSSPEFRTLMDGLRANARAGHVNSTKEQHVRSPLFASAAAIPAVRGRLRGIVHDWSGWQWLHTDPQTYAGPPAWDRLAELQPATLVVVGELDLPDFQAAAQHVAANAPHARLLQVPGVGHMCNMEAPDVITAAITDFLAG